MQRLHRRAHREDRRQHAGLCSAITFDAPARLHAVRYKLAMDASLNAIGSPSKALVTFTDVVKGAKDGQEYTEAKMNGFPEAATGDIEKSMKDE